MKTYGFIGSTGTGKSYRAIFVAGEREIKYVIDDGLLIMGNTVVAGKSAKSEQTKIASVKRALFLKSFQTQQVREAIVKSKPESILILGTSDHMVDTIAKNLELPPISERIYIEDVATGEEIQTAVTMRRDYGKHVIPVPTLEVKREFSGYFLDPLRIFKRNNKMPSGGFVEKTVIRPTFSYFGKYTISDYTVFQIVERVSRDIEGIESVSRFNVKNTPSGLYIDLDLIVEYGYKIRQLLDDFKENVVYTVDKFTALNIVVFDIQVKGIKVK